MEEDLRFLGILGRFLHFFYRFFFRLSWSLVRTISDLCAYDRYGGLGYYVLMFSKYP